MSLKAIIIIFLLKKSYNVKILIIHCKYKRQKKYFKTCDFFTIYRKKALNYQAVNSKFFPYISKLAIAGTRGSNDTWPDNDSEERAGGTRVQARQAGVRGECTLNNKYTTKRINYSCAMEFKISFSSAIPQLQEMKSVVKSRDQRVLELQLEADQLREQAARQNSVIGSLKKRIQVNWQSIVSLSLYIGHSALNHWVTSESVCPMENN